MSAPEAKTPTIHQQIEYWQQWQSQASESTWARERSDLVLQWVKELPVSRPSILDLGCGTGWFTSRLAELGKATGIDLNDAAMKAAALRWPDSLFLGGDLYQTGLEEASFDVVVSMQVIAHVPDQPKFIERVSQLLKPGGYFIVTTNNRFVMEHLGTKDWGSHRSRGHIEEWLTMTELKRLLARRFRVLRTRTLHPMGDGGILRFVNSVKVNSVLDRLLPLPSDNSSVRLREKLGLGYYLIVLAQKQQ